MSLLLCEANNPPERTVTDANELRLAAFHECSTFSSSTTYLARHPMRTPLVLPSPQLHFKSLRGWISI